MTLVFIVGTGTEIGKTHLGESLLLHLGRTARVVGYKPVESGVPEGLPGEDAERLRAASTFHVKPEPLSYRLRRPVGPHLAAREMGIALDVPAIVASIRRVAEAAEVALVEMAGGLFSPLTEEVSNADVVRSFPNAAVLLVAPDRLGVLHDLATTTRAAASLGIPLRGIVFSAPAAADASTGTNPAEARYVTSVPVLASLPRRPATELASGAAIAAVARALLTPPG
jgi:dethiobiotin synthetase